MATLAELLKSSGYATGAGVSSIVLSRSSGLARGFDFYDDAIEPTAPGHTAEALAAELRRMAGWLGCDDVQVHPLGDLADELAVHVRG